MYLTLETLTREIIENARGNEVSVKRADGAVFTVRHVDAMRYFVRDTREENSKGSGFALGMEQVFELITQKHIDKYGRAWQFTPEHSTDRMVKVPREVMERFILADRILSGNAINDYAHYFTGATVDCYILRSGDALRNGVDIYTGARYGDEGRDYYSSLINNKCVLLKLLQYLKGATDANNIRAIVELFPNLSNDSMEF